MALYKIITHFLFKYILYIHSLYKFMNYTQRKEQKNFKIYVLFLWKPIYRFVNKKPRGGIIKS